MSICRSGRLERKRKPLVRKNSERPTKKHRNVFEKDVACSLLSLSVPVRLQQSQSETLENPQPIKESVAQILLTLAEKVTSDNHTTNLENNNTNPTLNVDVNDYTSSPNKIESVDGDEVQVSTKENSTQVTDYFGLVAVGPNKI